jgi:hypothetical protein
MPADTTITSNPLATTTSRNATFRFSSTQAGSTFACSLDGVAFAVCATSKSYTGLATGSHNFQVQATDPAGNTDATPANFNWTIQ